MCNKLIILLIKYVLKIIGSYRSQNGRLLIMINLTKLNKFDKSLLINKFNMNLLLLTVLLFHTKIKSIKTKEEEIMKESAHFR